jgi:hypothetical protein
MQAARRRQALDEVQLWMMGRRHGGGGGEKRRHHDGGGGGCPAGAATPAVEPGWDRRFRWSGRTPRAVVRAVGLGAVA